MFLGMTPQNFWEDSPYLVINFRKSYELKREERNQMLWLQGLYDYRAFSAAMDEFVYWLNGKKGSPPKGYIKEPMPLTDREKEMEKQRRIKYTLEWVKKGQE